MVEPVNPVKREEAIQARPKSDQFKNYALIALGLSTAFLVYWLYKKEQFVIEINGQQFIMGAIILCVVLYWLFHDKGIPELPTKDVIALEAANWSVKNGYGLLDWTQSEVTQLSDQRAAIYFRLNEKTLIYQAGKGIIEERHRDLDSELKARQDGELIKNLNAQRARDESLTKHLQERGLMPNEPNRQ